MSSLEQINMNCAKERRGQEQEGKSVESHTGSKHHSKHKTQPANPSL